MKRVPGLSLAEVWASLDWEAKMSCGDDVAVIMENAQQRLERLRKQLYSFFPLERGEFSLHHDDISRHNLIVDFKGKLQALVDRECVSIMPLWKACHIPSFIGSLERAERPNSEDYMKNTDGSIKSL